jgi:hypothetical protein
MTRRFARLPQVAPVLRGLASATALLLVPAVSKGQSVNLQSASPGTPQTGNANVTGTIIAGKLTSNTASVGSPFLNADAFDGISSTGVGVYGASNSNYGVFASSSSSYGIYATSGSNNAIYAISTAPADVIFAIATGKKAAGVTGWSAYRGLYGYGYSTAATGTGVYGDGGTYGVEAYGGSGGVYSRSQNGFGVWGDSVLSTGVEGTAAQSNTIGVFGSNTNHGYGMIASSSGSFALFSVGNFGATGTKSFVIDHPLDPANKTLKHFCAEGAEPLNVYSGNVKTDRDGFATVDLPDWIESVNRDFRYQLTVVDDGDRAEFVQVKVVRRIAQHRFTLRTSVGDVDVSWQLTGARDDAWVRAHPATAEEEKSDDQRGKYWSPELYGASQEQSIIPAIATQPTPPVYEDVKQKHADARIPETRLPSSASSQDASSKGVDLSPTRTPEIHR